MIWRIKIVKLKTSNELDTYALQIVGKFAHKVFLVPTRYACGRGTLTDLESPPDLPISPKRSFE